MPNRLSEFWQELKRRKVLKVMTMYAGAAYVLIELVNNVEVPLNLPDWTPRLVIILVLIGIPVTAILSWIFDITPEGIKKTGSEETSLGEGLLPETVRRKLRISDGIIAFLFIAVCILIYPKIFNRDKFKDFRNDDGRISIAVMPLNNTTGDSLNHWFGTDISNILIDGLSQSPELSVIEYQTMLDILGSKENIQYASISPAVAEDIVSSIRVKSYIWGDFICTKDKLRINLKLIDTKSKQIVKTYSEENHPDSIIQMTRTLSEQIRNYLEIKVLEQSIESDYWEFALTSSAKAFRHFNEGLISIVDLDYELAKQSLVEAYTIDSTFTFAAFYLAWAYGYDQFVGNFQPEQWSLWTLKAYDTKERLPLHYQHWLELWYAITISKDLNDINRYCELLEESEIESRLLWFDLGFNYYNYSRQDDKAVEAFAKVEKINQLMGIDWEFLLYYWYYGKALHAVGNYVKEGEILELGERIFPDKARLTLDQVTWAFTTGDTAKANAFLNKAISRMEYYQWPRSEIELNIAYAYRRAKMMEKAEAHYRNAYEFNLQGPMTINALAQFLISHNISIEEGMELTEKGLQLDPENLNLLWTKGLGYFKQGKFEKALTLLKVVEEKDPFFTYSLHQDIQEAEQALAGQTIEFVEN